MDDFGTDRNPGRPTYSPGTRDLAFRIWLFEASQSPSRTARIAARDHGVELSDDIIRYWRDTEGWPDRVVAALSSFPGGVSVQAFIDLAGGGPQSLSYLRRLVDGDFPESETLAGHHLRLKAAVALKDSAGYSPLGRAEKPRAPVDDGESAAKMLPDLTDKSADELETLLRQQMETPR